MRSLLLVAGLVVAACGSTAAPPTPPAAAPSPAPAASASACLPMHICGCNLGCARVPVAAASLTEGMHTTAQTGPYKGTDMIVMKEADTAGASVFALSDREHTMACERESSSKSLLGFACASKDSGAVPAHACALGCD